MGGCSDYIPEFRQMTIFFASVSEAVRSHRLFRIINRPRRVSGSCCPLTVVSAASAASAAFAAFSDAAAVELAGSLGAVDFAEVAAVPSGVCGRRCGVRCGVPPCAVPGGWGVVPNWVYNGRNTGSPTGRARNRRGGCGNDGPSSCRN